MMDDGYTAWDEFASLEMWPDLPIPQHYNCKCVVAPFVYLEEHNQQYAIYIDYLNLLDRKHNLN
jgi:hypothetical protein